MLGRIVLLGFLSFSTAGFAASFDCTKATTFAEKEICRDGYLSSMDKILASEYKKAMNSADDKQALQISQRAWLEARDACTIQKCIDKSMSERIAVLTNYPRQLNRAAAVIAPPAATASAPRYLPSARADIREPEAASSDQLAQAPRLSSPSSRPVTKSNAYSKELSSQGPQAMKAQGKTSGFWDSPLWKYIALGLLCIVGASMALHHQGQLSIYTNYTDAVITNALPLTAGAAYLVMTWLELPDVLTIAMVVGVSIVWITFSAFSASVINNSAWKVLFALISKLILVSIFYIVAFALIASLVSTKYKDETRAQAAARNRRGNRETVAYLAGFATGYSFMTKWLCRDGRFTSVAECLGMPQASSEI